MRVIINRNKDTKRSNLIDEDEDEISVLEVKTTIKSIPRMSAYLFRIKAVIVTILRKGLRLEFLETTLIFVSPTADNKTTVFPIHILLGKNPFNVA